MKSRGSVSGFGGTVVARGPNIVLAGFMGSGKSTIGKIISRISGMRFAEIDEMIVSSEGMTIKEIFENSGENGFRRLEKEKIREVSTGEGAVIAVGGGAVLDPENVKMLKSNGIIYLLKVTAGEVRARVGNDTGRPLLGKEPEEVEQLMRSREKAYLESADAVFETDGKEPGRLAENIYSDYRKRFMRVEGSGLGY
ncbi:MAG: shikimate kinase [Actinobacteria bacterium]|nr:shikimate kinase [Actinomycetota bacterium]